MKSLHPIQIGTLNDVLYEELIIHFKNNLSLFKSNENPSNKKCPALVFYDMLTPWFIVYNEEKLELAIHLTESIALQSLMQYENGNAKLILFQSTIGQKFKNIKRLFVASNGLWGQQIHTNSNFLKYLNRLEEIASQRYLLLASAEVDDIYHYNKKHLFTEQIIYLIIEDIDLVQVDTHKIKQIQNLYEQGGKVGIVIFFLTKYRKVPHFTNEIQKKRINKILQEIQKASIGISLLDKINPINLHNKLWQIFENFNLKINKDNFNNKKIVDEILEQSQKKELTDKNKDFLTIKIGLTDASPFYFKMGEYSNGYHALIGGMIRTGKTTLLNNIIISACENYSPNELTFTLMDFKRGGVHFCRYENLQHIRRIYAPIEDEIEDAIECIEECNQILKNRSLLFRKYDVTDLTAYNNKSSIPICRHILIIDEVQNLFEECDIDQKKRVKKAFKKLATTSASYGIHIIFSTQSYQNVDLEKVKNQFHIRIGFKLATTLDCHYLMGRDNDAMLNVDRFCAIYNHQVGDKKYNNLVQMDYLSDNEFNERLALLKKQYPQSLNSKPKPTKTNKEISKKTQETHEDTSVFGNITLWSNTHKK